MLHFLTRMLYFLLHTLHFVHHVLDFLPCILYFLLHTLDAEATHGNGHHHAPCHIYTTRQRLATVSSPNIRLLQHLDTNNTKENSVGLNWTLA